MKRLQVGDECYVRNGNRELFKAKVVRAFKGQIDVFIPYLDYEQTLHREAPAEAGCPLLWNIVYPYPIIKQLAK